MVDISKSEAKLLILLMGEASDRMSRSSCNDFSVPNTDDNWLLYEKVCEWQQEELDEARPKKGEKIYFIDWILFDYFVDVFKKALK